MSAAVAGCSKSRTDSCQQKTEQAEQDKYFPSAKNHFKQASSQHKMNHQINEKKHSFQLESSPH